jgi:Fe-S oxidoreductase
LPIQREGLPALRQVQAGVRHPRAARQPAVQPAQQDFGHLAAGRGLFVRGADAPRRVSIKHWQEFEDVADHCTVCHKCLSPCPVKIDFGDVTMNMRNLLRKMGKKSFRPGNAAAMFMLNATNPDTIKLLRAAMVGVGFKAQRMANLLRGGAASRPRGRRPRWAPRRSRSR